MTDESVDKALGIARKTLESTYHKDREFAEKMGKAVAYVADCTKSSDAIRESAAAIGAYRNPSVASEIASVLEGYAEAAKKKKEGNADSIIMAGKIYQNPAVKDFIEKMGNNNDAIREVVNCIPAFALQPKDEKLAIETVKMLGGYVKDPQDVVNIATQIGILATFTKDSALVHKVNLNFAEGGVKEIYDKIKDSDARSCMIVAAMAAATDARDASLMKNVAETFELYKDAPKAIAAGLRDGFSEAGVVSGVEGEDAGLAKKNILEAAKIYRKDNVRQVLLDYGKRPAGKDTRLTQHIVKWFTYMGAAGNAAVDAACEALEAYKGSNDKVLAEVVNEMSHSAEKGSEVVIAKAKELSAKAPK